MHVAYPVKADRSRGVPSGFFHRIGMRQSVPCMTSISALILTDYFFCSRSLVKGCKHLVHDTELQVFFPFVESFRDVELLQERIPPWFHDGGVQQIRFAFVTS